MRTGLSFLIAAKRCETAALQQLVLTSGLVEATSRMVHDLQRERGLSSLYLGSGGTQFALELDDQLATSHRSEVVLRQCFDNLDTEPHRTGNGARLFNRIAYVLQAMDALPGLRHRVTRREHTAIQSTEAYVHLVSGLLAVVFETADTATDPHISKRLVGLFQFMQGKEWAGQERATGGAMYASARADSGMQERLLHLIESQERCLEVFGDLAGPSVQALWTESVRAGPLADLERLRRVLCTAPKGGALNPAMGQVWFGICSRRMDDMRAIEERMTLELQGLCTGQLTQAQQELAQLEALQNAMTTAAPPDTTLLPQTAHPAWPVLPHEPTTGSPVERSILALVQDQARRLQSVHEELENVRASLNERKVIERAKGLLMAHRQLSEEQAYRMLRQTAMNQNKRLADVAEAVLAMSDYL